MLLFLYLIFVITRALPEEEDVHRPEAVGRPRVRPAAVIDDAQHLADPREAVRVKHRHLPGLEKGLEARS